MQPNNNRPVYVTRPTIISTGASGQVAPIGAQLHPLSSVRAPIPMQMRPMISSPVYTTISSPQQAPTRLIKAEPTVRLPVRSSLPTNLSTPPMASTTPAAAASSSAAGSSTAPKDIVIRVLKSDALHGIMEFSSGITMDLKDGNTISLEREINPFTYRPPTSVDPNANSSSNTITTSLGVVLPKTGAGSEYGREQKEALKRKRYASKGTNLEDLPWLLTNRITNEKKLKYFRGMKKGGIASNSSYYVFIQTKDGFDAYPVNEWYSFTPTNCYATLDFDEAEKQYQDRNKKLSKWMQTHRPAKEKGDDDEQEDDEDGKKSSKKKRSDLQILDIDEFKRDDEDDDEDDDDDQGGSKKKKGKKSKNSGPTLTDDDDDDDERVMNVKKKRPNQKEKERQGEDSDDGDHEHDEIDYTSDETSEDEDDLRDVNTLKASVKYEVKGIDEEMKGVVDIEKKLERMDENGGEIDFDDDDEEIEIPDADENEEDSGGDDLGDVSTLLKNDPMAKDEESSSDDDDLDDSDDPEKDASESAASNMRPNPAEQILTEKGHKKARDEVMRDIKSKVISLSKSSSTPSHPADAITDERVRALLLQRKQMTFNELIQKFLPKANNRTEEIKKTIIDKLAAILKRLNFERKEIDGKIYIRLKN